MITICSITLLFISANHVEQNPASPAVQENNYVNLVTILPSEDKYNQTVTIRAEIEAEEDVAFDKIDKVSDIDTVREDYEKLRMVYELSKMSVTDDINKILSKSLDLIFDILPLDRGVVLLVDQSTGFLSAHYVKLRHGRANETREILLSSTIIHKVYYTRKCLVTSDAFEDPMLGKAASVRTGQIRSVICVPLIAHNKVYGILHLDSRDRINSYSNKDLSLVKAIGNQTAMVIENMNLIKEVEAKVRITEQLSRFLPPHVVDKMTNKSEKILKGGSEKFGTVVFADIRGFTNLSEKSKPVEVVKLLNEYFERVFLFHDSW
jgi:adenylate cyclase